MHDHETPRPKPGDYELGSLESRAAARAILDGRYPRNRLRVVVSEYRPLDLQQSRCTRQVWDNGTLFDFVELKGSASELTALQLEQFIDRFPIDGKKHTGAELNR